MKNLTDKTRNPHFYTAHDSVENAIEEPFLSLKKLYLFKKGALLGLLITFVLMLTVQPNTN